MSEFVTAIGLVFVIEGLIMFALGPGRLKQLLAMASEMPEQVLRSGGLVAVAIGVAIVWIARSLMMS